MVYEGNPQELAGFDQALRQRAIFTAGGRIVTGVIVTTHEGRRVGDNGGFEDFPHMHNAGREAPDGDGIEPNRRVFAVQQGPTGG